MCLSPRRDRATSESGAGTIVSTHVTFMSICPFKATFLGLGLPWYFTDSYQNTKASTGALLFVDGYEIIVATWRYKAGGFLFSLAVVTVTSQYLFEGRLDCLKFNGFLRLEVAKQLSVDLNRIVYIL